MITYRKPDTIPRGRRHLGVMPTAVAAFAPAAAATGCSGHRLPTGAVGCGGTAAPL
jgi:hypothetical protein